MHTKPQFYCHMIDFDLTISPSVKAHWRGAKSVLTATLHAPVQTHFSAEATNTMLKVHRPANSESLIDPRSKIGQNLQECIYVLRSFILYRFVQRKNVCDGTPIQVDISYVQCFDCIFKLVFISVYTDYVKLWCYYGKY